MFKFEGNIKLFLNRFYFIAVIPHEELQREVTSFKNYIKEHYFSKAALNSPPHITLYPPFKWDEVNEKLIDDSLNDFVVNKQSFEIKLEGFDHFSHRVIFIKPLINHALNRLQSELLHHLRVSVNLWDPKETRKYFPHMTIANRDLKKKDFYPAWEEFMEKDFQREFIVKSLFLLKHNGNFWDNINEYLFPDSLNNNIM